VMKKEISIKSVTCEEERVIEVQLTSYVDAEKC